MTKDHAKELQQLKNLQEEVELHNHLYYKENNPKISDFEYDCLKSELERLEAKLKISGKDAISQRIGDDRAPDFEKEKHLSPMFSLSNTYSEDEVLDYDKKTRKTLCNQQFQYVIEPKIDGIAINLIFIDGIFTQAITRGNGTVGDDVTKNILTIQDFPRIINKEIFSSKAEIRGEVYLDEKTFLEENRQRADQGLQLYSNPRNLAAGTVKCLKINEVEKRKLKLIVYAIGYSQNQNIKTQHEVLNQLAQAGFQSQSIFYVAKDIDEALIKIKTINELSKSLPYWTDGAVIKIDQLNLHKTLGETSKAPRWAIAYKYSPDTAETKVKNILLQVGRTGVITPVADLEPVEISGSVVSRATLHNAEDLQKKDIRINDYVIIEKAGEIIPAIISVNLTKRPIETKQFIFPKYCPACNTQLIKIEDEVAWKCPNNLCSDQIKAKIEYFCSREAMDITNLGEAVINQLVDSQNFKNIADIYTVTFDVLTNSEKLGKKSSMNILKSIELSKKQPLWRLINGLGITGVGVQTSKDLTKSFTSLDLLMKASSEQLCQLDGIGDKLSETIVRFFQNSENQTILNRLKQSGVNLSQAENSAESSIISHKLSNLKFAITGTFPNTTRNDITRLIEAHGGVVKNNISSNTNYLIEGDNGSSKLEKAKSLNIKTITLEDLRNLIYK